MNTVMWESEEDQMSSLDLIENQVYALNGRVDDLRTDVKATQVAVHALSDRVDRRMDKADAKIEAMGMKFEAKIDALSRKMDEKFDALSTRIGEIALRLARIESVHMTVVWVCGGFLTLVFSLIGLGKALSWF
jgi:outer membrane murein-binding lipoprotein Lpp